MEQLAKFTLSLSNNHDKAMEMGLRGKRLVKENFSIEKVEIGLRIFTRMLRTIIVDYLLWVYLIKDLKENYPNLYGAASPNLN